jgi:hypothetical protein
VRARDGSIRIVGRRGTDLINSGGYRIGAGEVESALLEHESVAEAAVLGEPDPDLGEKIVAWVALREGAIATEEELIDHVARGLAPHKRPGTSYSSTGCRQSGGESAQAGPANDPVMPGAAQAGVPPAPITSSSTSTRAPFSTPASIR